MGSYWLQLPVFIAAVSCTLHCKFASALGICISPSWPWFTSSASSAMESGVWQKCLCWGIWVCSEERGEVSRHRTKPQSMNSDSLQMGFKSDIHLERYTVYGLQRFCGWKSAFIAAGSKFLWSWSSKQWHEDPCQRLQRAPYFRIRYSSVKMFVYGKYRGICKKFRGGKRWSPKRSFLCTHCTA